MTLNFNLNKPIESISNFCNKPLFLKQEEKDQFIEKARQFFAQKAYYNENIAIPEESKKRFSDDVSFLLKATSLPNSEKKRLLATIQKVTKLQFNGLNERFQVYQTKSEHPSNMGSFWGWMNLATCRSSGWKVPSLTSDLSEEIMVSTVGLTPAIQYTLDHISQVLYNSEEKGGCNFDFSLEALSALHQFTTNEKISLPRLEEIYSKAMSEKKIELVDGKELKERLKTSLNPVVVNREGIEMPFHVIDDNQKYYYGRDGYYTVNSHLYGSSGYTPFSPSINFNSPSPTKEVPFDWWNDKNPFESIARFTDRFSVLNPSEQRAAIQTIKDFFFRHALENKNIKPLDAERFSKVDLEFLLSTIPTSLKFERDRFVAAVQKVTQLQFNHLRKEDQVYPLEINFAGGTNSSGWLKSALVGDRPSGNNSTFYLGGMNRQLALALQKFQYNELTTDDIEDFVKLHQYLKQTSFESLKKWLLDKFEKEQSAQWDTPIASTLHDPACFAFFSKNFKHALRIETASLSEKSIYHALKFNFFDLKDNLDAEKFKNRVSNSIDKASRNALRALSDYSKEVSGKDKEAIGEVILDLICEHHGFPRELGPHLYRKEGALEKRFSVDFSKLRESPAIKKESDKGIIVELSKLKKFREILSSEEIKGYFHHHDQVRAKACNFLDVKIAGVEVQESVRAFYRDIEKLNDENDKLDALLKELKTVSHDIPLKEFTQRVHRLLEKHTLLKKSYANSKINFGGPSLKHSIDTLIQAAAFKTNLKKLCSSINEKTFKEIIGYFTECRISHSIEHFILQYENANKAGKLLTILTSDLAKQLFSSPESGSNVLEFFMRSLESAFNIKRKK